MASPIACATCQFNPVNQPEREPPSLFCSYLFELENTLNMQIPLGDFKLTRLDRRALTVVKSERQQAELRRIKEGNRQ